MRIIHLSDIHLSSDNIEELRLYYLNSLIADFKQINNEKEIDLIIISGDLVDKGGSSLLNLQEYRSLNNPYDIFEKEFIIPLCKNLPFIKERIIFIPGNHDIDRGKIDEVIEAGLISLLITPQKVNEISHKYLSLPHGININRIGPYLDFEKKYHDNNKFLSYDFSNLESKVIYNYKGHKIGIALINDTWRCSLNKVSNHFVGTNQFHKALQYFKQENTSFNIAVMHHPLECFNTDEKDEIENILLQLNFQMLFIGHEHKRRVLENNLGNNKKILILRGRSAFDKPHEKNSDYSPGYSVIDIEFDNKEIGCSFKKYYKNTYEFNLDLENGIPNVKFSYGIDEIDIKKIDNLKEDFILEFNKKDFISNFEDEN